MKKIAIAIISSIYAISIILIAFLGISGEILPSKIVVNVEQIVLDEVKGLDRGNYEYHYDGTDSEETLVYGVYSRPREDEINPETGEDQNLDKWDIDGVKMQYIVKIYNFNFIYDTEEWKFGQQKGTFKINSQVLPENASIQNVIYATSYTSSNISLSENGLITFEKLTTTARFTVTAKALDNSGTTSNIRFLVRSYK